MSFVQCHYCHKMVPEGTWESHEAAHLKLRSDGQRTDYAKLPAELQYQGSLDGVPRWYRHSVCGEVTGMPEYIIRTYMVDPYFYDAGRTYCHGCSTHVCHDECYWEETGECLSTYFSRMRQHYEATKAAKQAVSANQFTGQPYNNPQSYQAMHQPPRSTQPPLPHNQPPREPTQPQGGSIFAELKKMFDDLLIKKR